MKLSAKVAAIHFDQDVVRAAVIKTGRRPRLLEAAAAPVESKEGEERFDALVAAVQTLRRKLKSQPQTAVLCANVRDSIARNLRIPFKGANKIKSAVQFELEPYLAFPVDQLVVDHLSIREVEGETDVLAAGLRIEAVEEQLAACEAAGMSIEGIDLDAAGMTALWLAAHPSPKGLHLLLHVQEEGAVLVLLEGRRIVSFRSLDAGRQDLLEGGAAVRQVSSSVRAFLASWETEQEVTGLHVCAGNPEEIPADSLSDQLGMPVETIDLGAVIQGRDKALRGLQAEGESVFPEGVLPALTGCAMAASGRGPGFNFRRGALANPNAARGMLVHAGLSAALVALLLLLYGGYMYVDYRAMQREIDRAGDRVWDVFLDAFPQSEIAQQGRPPGDVAGMQTMQEMERLIDEFGGVGSGFDPDVLARPSLLEILMEITTHLSPDQVELTELRVRPGRGSQLIVIKGEVLDSAGFMAELERLRESDMLRIEDDPLVSAKGDTTTFTITART